MRRARQAAQLLALPTLGLGIALVVAPNRAELEVHVWLLVVLGLVQLAFLVLVRATYPSAPSAFTASLRQLRVAVERPGTLVRLERVVSMAGSAAFDVHYRLRPFLVETAAELLWSRRGIDLEREPERAHAVLGDDVWELVRPDRPQPAQRDGAGIDAAQLDDVVSALERI